MNGTPASHGKSRMTRAIKLREQRQKLAAERSLWQNLSMIGALGWLIVVPTLLGVVIGRWLDAIFGTGILFSGALIFLGVTLGGYLAWQRINKEPDS
jgi:ATP synthase protein I